MVTPSGRVLTVGSGQQYGSLNAALAASQDGDVIAVQAGTYSNDYATVTHSVTIEGVGGRAHFTSSGLIPNDKAILIDQAAELTLVNLEFSGAQVAEFNGAGIRYERGNLTIKNSYFHDNENGILGGAVAGGNVTIDGSSFVHNGAGDGQTHGAYLGAINSLTVTNSFFQDQVGGSAVKSRAAFTDVENNRFIDTPNGTTNYQVDLPNGGNDTVSGNIVLKSANAENRAIIHFGGEVTNPIGNLRVTNNQFYSDRDPSVVVLNHAAGQPILLQNNGISSATLSVTIDGSTANTTVGGTTQLALTSEPSTALVLPTALDTGITLATGNAPPLNHLPGDQSIMLGSTKILSGLYVTDTDGAGQTFTVKLDAVDGTLSTSGAAGSITGNGTGHVTLAGSLASVNTDLGALGFTATAPGAGSLQIQTSDGAGGTDSDMLAISVAGSTAPTASGHILTVGAGKQYATLSQAAAASQDGDIIQVQAGTYANDYTTITHSVTIQGVGGFAHFTSTGMIPNDKAILIDQAANLTIQNLEFSGAQVWDSNGAGIRYESGNLVVQNSWFHNNQDGILGNSTIAGAKVTIDGSTFNNNGAGDGQSHGVYFGHIDQLTVTNSFFQDQLGGSHVKSRAAVNYIDHNRFIDTDFAGDSTNYQVDLPEGGNDTISNNMVLKSSYPQNFAIIHFGGEVPNPIGSLLVQNNTFFSGRNPSVVITNQTQAMPIQVLNNAIDTVDIHTIINGTTANTTVSGSTTVDIFTQSPATDLILPTLLPASGPTPPPANIAPVNAVPGAQTMVNGTALAIAGLALADADGAGQSFTLVLDAVGGTVSTSGGAGTIAGNGSGSVTLSGSLANMNADLAAVTYKASTVGAGSLTVTSRDNAGGSDKDTVAITVTAPANLAPVNTVPGAQTVVNGGTLALSGLAIADADGAGQSFTVILNAVGGTVSTSGGAGSIAGNGSGSVTLSGSLANMNADLAALSYKPTAVGAGSLTIISRDGAGGSDTDSIAITATAPPNVAPVNQLPGAQSVIDGSTLALGGLSVSDADGATQSFTVGLHAVGGTISTSGGAGTIAGNGSADITLSGTLANINADLAALSYKGSAIGAGSLQITTNDGKGGIDTDTLAIAVTDAAPVNSLPGSQTVLNGSSLAIKGVSISDVEGASQKFTVALHAVGGTLSTSASAGTIAGNGSADLMLSGSLANVNTDLAALIYKGTSVGAGSLQITTNDGAGGIDTDLLAISVTSPVPKATIAATGKSYASLSTALSAAHDGDTILLDAGTWNIGRTTINKAVTIDGNNGIAKLVASGSIANGASLLTTTANVTLQDIEIAGVTSGNHSATAISSTAGNLTLSRVSVHDSDSALSATGTSSIINVFNSDFGRNGGGKNAAVNIGSVAEFELDNSKVHDSLGVTQVRSLARTTGFDHDQILDGKGSPIYALDLPNVGNVVINDTAFQRGAGALNSTLMHIGGGTAIAGTLRVQNSSFVSDVAGTHVIDNQAAYITVGFINDTTSANITQIGVGPYSVYFNDHYV